MRSDGGLDRGSSRESRNNSSDSQYSLRVDITRIADKMDEVMGYIKIFDERTWEERFPYLIWSRLKEKQVLEQGSGVLKNTSVQFPKKHETRTLYRE